MADTANEDFLDALIRHQIGLMRLSGSIRNRVIEILDATEADIRAEIERRLRRGLSNSQRAARLRVLERVIRGIRTKAWDEVTRLMLDEMYELSRAEPEFLATAAKTVAPVNLNLVLPTVATLRALVDTQPFEGRVLRDWAAKIKRDDLERIMGQVRIGVVQGEGSRDIARRVIGSARLRGGDGVTAITRRNAEAITRTMVNAISNQAKRAFYLENADVFEKEVYVATLDARTTPVCRANDGKRFPVGEGPIPPLHYACRSTRVAVLDDELLGQRPTKSSTERMLLREYARKNNLPPVSSRGALPRGHRGAFDQFSRVRVRQLTGVVPAKVDYETFLRRQSVEFQEDVLGKTKALLFRRGNLTLDRFVNRRGDELTLAELAARDKAAFRAAGLNPDDYL